MTASIGKVAQPPHRRDAFDDHRPADQVCRACTSVSRRQHGVPERIADDDAALGRAFGAGKRHVILAIASFSDEFQELSDHRGERQRQRQAPASHVAQQVPR